jgi:hypothetical protein
MIYKIVCVRKYEKLGNSTCVHEYQLRARINEHLRGKVVIDWLSNRFHCQIHGGQRPETNS